MGKGSYILILQIEHALADLQIGRLGHFAFAEGYYLYVGSAFGPGGLRARLGHHERCQKARPHWHIDYLRAHARLCEAWTVCGAPRLECRWCAALTGEPGVTAPVAGFGVSDTRCRSHLFYLAHMPRPRLLSRVILSDLVVDGPAELQIEIHHFDTPA